MRDEAASTPGSPSSARPLASARRWLASVLRRRVVFVLLAVLVVGDLWWLSRIDSQFRTHSTVGHVVARWGGSRIAYTPYRVDYLVIRNADGSLSALRWNEVTSDMPVIDHIVGWMPMSSERGWYAPVERESGYVRHGSATAVTPAEEAVLAEQAMLRDAKDGLLPLAAAEISALIATGRHSYPDRPILTGHLHNAGAIILWSLFAGAIGVRVRDGVIGMRRAREQFRRERGLCGKCAYDLGGLESAVCPECGVARVS